MTYKKIYYTHTELLDRRRWLETFTAGVLKDIWQQTGKDDKEKT